MYSIGNFGGFSSENVYQVTGTQEVMRRILKSMPHDLIGRHCIKYKFISRQRYAVY